MEVSGLDVHYSGEKLLSQLFSTENNLSIYALSIYAFSRFCNCSPFYIRMLKWTEKDLHPIGLNPNMAFKSLNL